MLTNDELMAFLKDKLRLKTSAIEPDTSLFESGLVDSFSIVELVVFIETACKIKMGVTEITLDNLDSVEKVLAFVERTSGNK